MRHALAGLWLSVPLVHMYRWVDVFARSVLIYALVDGYVSVCVYAPVNAYVAVAVHIYVHTSTCSSIHLFIRLCAAQKIEIENRDHP